MKICWDNLERVVLTKHGNFRVPTTDSIYYIKICKTCGEEYLGSKTASVCNKSCRRLSKEHKEKISKANTNKVVSEETKEKIRKIHTNKVVSEETKEKIKNTLTGRSRSEKTKQKISIAHVGKIISEETKKKISEAIQGEKHWNWQGGLSYDEYCPIFSDKEFKQMIRDRDGNICLNCGKTKDQNCKDKRELVGHHIDYDKQNCETKNIITLCTGCNIKANSKREEHTEWYRATLKELYGYKYE